MSKTFKKLQNSLKRPRVIVANPIGLFLPHHQAAAKEQPSGSESGIQSLNIWKNTGDKKDFDLPDHFDFFSSLSPMSLLFPFLHSRGAWIIFPSGFFVYQMSEDHSLQYDRRLCEIGLSISRRTKEKYKVCSPWTQSRIFLGVILSWKWGNPSCHSQVFY